ncbi:hypothetical protein [Staphylococcus haemolyticus]|nr:hypothetical protein [Staphylococcus haemolyticus]
MFDEGIERFKGRDRKIVDDFGYSGFGFDGKKGSILGCKDGKEVGIEIF